LMLLRPFAASRATRNLNRAEWFRLMLRFGILCRFNVVFLTYLEPLTKLLD
jgi:hypothetical protein